MQLTNAEEQIMRVLWEMGEGIVSDIRNTFKDPKPARNTISTVVRILEKKGYVNYTAYGKAHEYYPVISKKEYTKTYFGHFMQNYFGNSYREMVSFFTRDNNLDIRELEQLKQAMAEEIIRKKIEENE